MSVAASIIVVASEGRESIARLLHHLRRQTIAARLELIVAARPDHVSGIDGIDVSPIPRLAVVAADFSTSARARVGALAEARAPVVVMAEDHAFPVTDDWAERVVARHDEGYAVVGPVLGNANPATPLSWANLLLEYGPWLRADGATEAETLPGHNSSYRRDVLLRYGEEIGAMLEAEWVLHKDLAAKGERLLHEPAVRVRHLNFSLPGRSLELHLFEGWMFAASRARTWSMARRALYALTFPGIAGVRFVRIMRILSRLPGPRPSSPAIAANVAMLLAASALGEGIGYAFGDCGQRHRLARLEYLRWRNMRADEAELALAPV